MNQDFLKGFRFRFNDSGFSVLLTLLLIALLLGSVGLGWIVNGVLILFALLLLAPAIAWLGLRWWLKRNLIEDRCPVCSYEFTGFKGTECQCPNCGEFLRVESGHFHRLTPPGTIDVEAIEVPVKQLED